MAFNFWGIPSTIEKLPIQEPLQQAGINQLFQQGMQNYNPDAQEKYASEQFAKRVPGIAERLNMLSGGQQRGQAANYQLGALSSDLQSQLSGLRYQHGLNQLKLGLTPQYEYLYRGEQPGILEAGAQGLASSLGQALPGLAGKGAEYLAGKFGGPAGEAAAGAASALAPAGVEALKSAFPSPQAPIAGQAPQDISKLAQAATLMKKAGPEAAAAAAPTAIGALKAAGTPAATTGAVEVAKQTAGQALKQGFINTASAAAKYGLPAVGAAIIAKGVYGMIRDKRAEERGPQPEALPANWNEMSGADQYQYKIARQIATPQGQISHDAIRRMEYDLGIEPDEKLSWQDRYAKIVDKKRRK